MAIPSNKSHEITSALDDMSLKLNGITRTDAINQDICISCMGPATTFRSAISEQEYAISGLCQDCQDSAFGKD